MSNIPNYFDVFNGDADGICALIQLRNSEPREASLITGVKRDISLLKQVDAKPGDKVTVLDVSMDKNSDDLNRLLANGSDVIYIDHHFPGDIPEYQNLTAIINEAPDTCTSILVNKYLKGEFALWAITGAFGDNLKKSARSLAAQQSITEEEILLLEKLGIYINYNGYGAGLEDLHFTPTELYQKLVVYKNPLDFIRGGTSKDSHDFTKLENGYRDDMAAAAALEPKIASANSAIFILPNEKWARRVSGVYSNDLANQNPDRAHAVLTEKSNGNYLVSVRAPINNKTGAVDLCRQFPTGGGRAAAAGINDLPVDLFDAFTAALEAAYSE